MLGITCLFLIFISINNSICEDIEVHGTIEEIAAFHGYQTQSFIVTTDDGFNLQIFRIMCKDNCSTSTKPRQPLVIWPGFLLNARFYVVNGIDSFGFYFVNQGYDVYLANTRGTIFCNHTTLTRADKGFWDFGNGVVGKQDMRLTSLKINQMTNQKIITMAYATTTNSLIAYASLYPDEVAQTQKGFIMYGVITNIFQTRTIFFPLLGVIADPFRDITYLLGLKYLDTSFTQNCQYPINYPLCNGYINTIMGESDHINVNESFPRFFGEGTEPLPTTLIVNLAQIIQHGGQARDLDYGVAGNLEHYNKINPDMYDLSAIKDIRIDIICTGDNEYTCEDAKSTYNQLSVNKTFTYLPDNDNCHGNMIHFNYFMNDDMDDCMTGPINKILSDYY